MPTVYQRTRMLGRISIKPSQQSPLKCGISCALDCPEDSTLYDDEDDDDAYDIIKGESIDCKIDVHLVLKDCERL